MKKRNKRREVKKMAVDSKYPDFIESTGYGKVDGLCGINCR